MATPNGPGDGIHVALRDLLRLEHQGGFSLLPKQPVHSLLTGRHASRLRGRGLLFEELRRYQSGDDPRSIDWRVTARTGRAHVRVNKEERDRPVMVVVDQRSPMFFGSRRAMKSVAAAEAAALVAWRGLAAGDRVGGLVFGDDDAETVFVEPRRSRDTVLHLLHAIVTANGRLHARTEAPPDTGALDRALDRIGRVVTHDGLVAIVSDLHGAGPDTRGLVTDLARRNDVLVFAIHDALERDLPDAGRVVATQAGLQLEIDTSDPRFRARFRDDFETRRTAMRSAARRGFVGLLEIDPGEPTLRQILRQLGHLEEAGR